MIAALALAPDVGAEGLIIDADLADQACAGSVVERSAGSDALLNIARAVSQIDLFEMTDAQCNDCMGKLHGAPASRCEPGMR